MRHRRTTTALAAAAVGAALIATGCGSSSAADPTPTSVATTTTAATTTAATPSDTAIDQAKQAITAYFRVYDQLAGNPAGADPAVNTVASGQAKAVIETGLQGLVKRGIHIVGDTSITRWTVHDANITNADAEVAADVCIDVSKTQVLDAKGTPQPHGPTMQAAAPDGSDTIITVPWRDQRLARFIVHNSSWPDPAGWRVTQAEMRNAPCE